MLIGVNLGAELFRYLTRKSLIYENDRQNFRDLRNPLFAFYCVAFIVYQGLALLVLYLNRPEMIKIYDPYNQQLSIENLTSSRWIYIHCMPTLLILAILINNICFVEQDRTIGMRFQGASQTSFMGAMRTAKKYSYLATLIPFIIFGTQVTVVFYWARACGIITYGTMFIICSQLTSFNNEFENFHNMYGAIIAYANPAKLYDRNERYADV